MSEITRETNVWIWMNLCVGWKYSLLVVNECLIGFWMTMEAAWRNWAWGEVQRKKHSENMLEMIRNCRETFVSLMGWFSREDMEHCCLHQVGWMRRAWIGCFIEGKEQRLKTTVFNTSTEDWRSFGTPLKASSCAKIDMETKISSFTVEKFKVFLGLFSTEVWIHFEVWIP
jgi:hypothetical protein